MGCAVEKVQKVQTVILYMAFRFKTDSIVRSVDLLLVMFYFAQTAQMFLFYFFPPRPFTAPLFSRADSVSC